jgi:hypothetical protein
MNDAIDQRLERFVQEVAMMESRVPSAYDAEPCCSAWIT